MTPIERAQQDLVDAEAPLSEADIRSRLALPESEDLARRIRFAIRRPAEYSRVSRELGPILVERHGVARAEELWRSVQGLTGEQAGAREGELTTVWDALTGKQLHALLWHLPVLVKAAAPRRRPLGKVRAS